MCAQLLGLFATPWTVARQAPLTMGFSRQENWSGWLFSSGDLPDPRIEPGSPTLAGRFFTMSYQGNPNNAYIRWQSKHSGETYSRGRRRGKQGCELHFKERWSGNSPWGR